MPADADWYFHLILNEELPVPALQAGADSLKPEDRHSIADCQLQVLAGAARPLTVAERVCHWILRIDQAVARRIQRLRSTRSSTGSSSYPDIVVAAEPAEFSAGEIVQVRPLQQIRAMLDDKGCTDRLTFIPGMERYCGREMKVLKRVYFMFDERAWRLLSLTDTYLLEGAICDGRGHFGAEGCDRSCYYFWKSAWLEKAGTDRSG
jgi:hypothetical protein